MKRLNFLFILCCLFFVSVACAADEVRNANEKDTAWENAVKIYRDLKMTSGILEEFDGDLPAMMKRGKIRVLTTYTYLNYFVHQGQTRGFEYDMMEEYKNFLKKGTRKSTLQFYYIPVPYHLLVPALKRGYGDIAAAGMTVTPERSQEIDFTDPYLDGLKEYVITRTGADPIRTVADLSGKEIHVREGTSYVHTLNRINEDFSRKNIPVIDLKELSPLLNTGEIIEMVQTGILPRTVADSHIATLAGQLLPGIELHRAAALNQDVKIAWMVRKTNPELRRSLNKFVETVKGGTLKGNIIFNRYYKKNPWARQALKRNDLDRLSRYALLFRKYGEKYRIDWILIAAQAYQESGFNPDARSHMGAVGLMQLLPATARDMGFKDISTPENNIHAGVKYMRWLIDHYFSDPAMTEDDRARFALAAYNAGPGNMRRSRKRAVTMGYDSDLWFFQTELATLRTVSLEPVHYVRNINRYYLSFLMSLRLETYKKEQFKKSKYP